jgi:H+/gluconate symporter-like permease
MENTVTTVLIAVLTGIITSVIGAAMWHYWLQKRIDKRIAQRARQRDEDEAQFQKIVDELVANPRLEADFAGEALMSLVNTRAQATRAYIWLACAILLVAQAITIAADSQIALFALSLLSVYALALAFIFVRATAKHGVWAQKVWHLVIEARQKQKGRGPDFVEVVEKMGRR